MSKQIINSLRAVNQREFFVARYPKPTVLLDEFIAAVENHNRFGITNICLQYDHDNGCWQNVFADCVHDGYPFHGLDFYGSPATCAVLSVAGQKITADVIPQVNDGLAYSDFAKALNGLACGSPADFLALYPGLQSGPDICGLVDEWLNDNSASMRQDIPAALSQIKIYNQRMKALGY